MPTPHLPTRDDLRRLPRWARVAFAVWCARRAQPLLRRGLPAAGARQVQAVERAISRAEAVAREAPARATDKMVIQLHAAFSAASRAAQAVKAQSPAASAVLLAAAEAARAAEWACCRAPVADSKSAAACAAASYAADPTEGALAALYGAWQELLGASQAAGWDDASPIPARFLGVTAKRA
jgi:hypothetical protein